MIKEMPVELAKVKMHDLGFSFRENEEEWHETSLGYAFENDAVSKSLLGIAKFVSAVYQRHGEAVVSLSLLRVWPSSHDKFLIDILLKDFIEIGYLPADGTLLHISGEESDRVATIFHLAMLSGWEITMWLGDPRVQIHLDHDAEIQIFAATQSDRWIADFKDFSGGRMLTVLK